MKKTVEKQNKNNPKKKEEQEREIERAGRIRSSTNKRAEKIQRGDRETDRRQRHVKGKNKFKKVIEETRVTEYTEQPIIPILCYVCILYFETEI